jgi:hypothetical protein
MTRSKKRKRLDEESIYSLNSNFTTVTFECYCPGFQHATAADCANEERLKEHVEVTTRFVLQSFGFIPEE